MTFRAAIQSGFKELPHVSGRATRSEFWYWVLFLALVCLVGFFTIGFVAAATGVGEEFNISLYLGFNFLALPAAVRRLHDIGKSGWWLLIGFVPFGGIVLLVFYVRPTKFETNEWGPPPAA